ncbi:MAG: hypothetical protein ACP5JR_01380, partial [Thermoplasmata archaeon]
WYYGTGTAKEGNYWSNWDGSGWGTSSAYPIDGGAGASDYYPLSDPVVSEFSGITAIVFCIGILMIAMARKRKKR